MSVRVAPPPSAALPGGVPVSRERQRGAFWAQAAALLSRWSPSLVFLGLAAALFSWVTWDAFWFQIITYSPGSDYWEHSAALRALIEDPWSPRNPHLDSPASSPRFGPFFVLVALLARALSLDALGAMGLAAVLNTLLFLLGIYAFFRTYFQAAWAPVIGLVVLFGSWWEGWHFSNVYQLKVYFSVAGYPSTTALASTLLGFALTISELRARRPRALALGALSVGWAFILITHPLTAMMSLSGALLLSATLPGVDWRRRCLVGSTVAAGALVCALWPYFSAWEVILGGKGSDAKWVQRGIQSVAEKAGGNQSHFFYRPSGLLNTLGLALLGIPVALYLLVRGRWFIPLGALAMGAPFVLNMYVPLPLGHRFILLAVFYLQLAVVWLLLRCLPKGSSRRMGWLGALQRWVPIACVLSILGYFGWINVQKAAGRFEYTERRYRGNDSPQVRLGRRIAELAEPRSIVLADDVTSWSIPTFGPRVVSLFHGNPLVADEDSRTAAVRRFFRGGVRDRERSDILAEYRVTHVVVRRSRERHISRFLSRRAERQLLPAGYVLYTLNPS